MSLMRRFQPIPPRSSLLTIYKLSIRNHFDFADYEQAYNSSFHEKLESLECNTCLAITETIRGTRSRFRARISKIETLV